MSKKAVLVNVSGDKDGERVLKELEALADTAGYTVEASLVQRNSMPDRRYYIGSGKDLTGSQFHNLETYLGVTVIDRATLIIEIFAAHARSNEGKLQVELAAKRQALPRVIGKGIAMSRQGGGGGGGGGARRGGGEQQLELDKRTIRREIRELEQKIEKLGEERRLRREKRVKNDLKVVSIAGYTNAGKSTLMNALTKADVLEEDKLFATLDPVGRKLWLAPGREFLLVDTVGFISRLPHAFVQAFRSTLEEVVYSDLILHVVDASNPQREKQMQTVYETFRQLKIQDKKIITVFNKMDKAEDTEFLKDVNADEVINISAKKKIHTEELLQLIEDILMEGQIYVEHLVKYADAGVIQKIRRNGVLLKEEYRDNGIYVEAYVPLELTNLFGSETI